jgi:hypothetical protein
MQLSLRPLLPFIPAIIGAYTLGSVLVTQVNLAELEGLGVRLTLRDRLHATGHDLLGLTSTYLPLISVAFLIAFPVATYLARWVPKLRLALYSLAGVSAVLALHLTLKAVLGLNGIAAVRSAPGFLLQGLAGWFGAYLYFVATGWAHRSSPPHGGRQRV